MKKMFFLMPVLVVLLVAVALVGIAEESSPLTYDEMLAREGTYYYVMESNTFVEVPGIIKSMGDNCGLLLPENEEKATVTLDRLRQQLVLSSTSESYSYVSFRDVKGFEYIYPVQFDSYFNVVSYGIYTLDGTTPIKNMGRINNKTIDSVYEVDPQSPWYGGSIGGIYAKRFFGMDRYMWVTNSRRPKEITVSEYRGTRYFETSVMLDAKLYEFGDRFDVNIERTKNGYFIVDTSELKEGLYYFSGASCSCFIRIIN